MAYQVTAGRFIGRAQELARLRDVLARAATGEPLVALVGGEAGIGKTRLADQLAATANQQGVRVLRGGCVRGGVAEPAQAAGQLLVQQAGPLRLARRVGQWQGLAGQFRGAGRVAGRVGRLRAARQ